MRVAGYCRVSTLEQAANGTSTSTQKAAIEAECNAKNFQLTEIYCDDGVSGKNDDRLALNKLRENAKLKKFDCIMFTKLDRLGRNARDLHNIAYEFEQLEINLYCIEQPDVNKGGKFYFAILGAFAEFERDVIKGRTDLGRQEKWKKQKTIIGSLPFGYKKINNLIEIDEQNAAIYDRIVSMYIDQNYSMKDIALVLTTEGIPIPTKSSKMTNLWNTSTIGDILKNEAYTGETYQNRYVFEAKKSKKSGRIYYSATKNIKDKSEWIKIVLPTIISKDRFEQIQKRIAHQKQKQKKYHYDNKNNFLAENILYCDYCGSKLSKRRAENKYLHYVCHWSRCSPSVLYLNGHKKCFLKPISESEAGAIKSVRCYAACLKSCSQ